MTAIKAGNELEPGDTLVGTKGGTSYIYTIEPSAIMPGLLSVDTEHGTLRIDPDEDYEVENV